jgi:hypothetical protein
MQIYLYSSYKYLFLLNTEILIFYRLYVQIYGSFHIHFYISVCIQPVFIYIRASLNKCLSS